MTVTMPAMPVVAAVATAVPMPAVPIAAAPPMDLLSGSGRVGLQSTECIAGRCGLRRARQ